MNLIDQIIISNSESGMLKNLLKKPNEDYSKLISFFQEKINDFTKKLKKSEEISKTVIEEKLKGSEERLLRLNEQLEQDIIERTRELAKSEEKYKDLFSNMKCGVAVYEVTNNGVDFIFRDINKAGEEISQVTKEKIIGKGLIELFPGVIKSGLYDAFKKVYQSSKPTHHPITLYKDERIEHWMENYIYKLSSGEIVSVYDDITEKKNAEEKLKLSEKKYRNLSNQLEQKVMERTRKLRESESKFKLLYENAPLAYQSLDYNGKLLDVNQAWLDFLGYNKEDVIGEWFGSFLDKEYLNVLNNRFPKFKEDGEVIGVEYEVIKKDGSHAIVLFNGKIGYDDNMNFERTHCIFHDITERKKAEQKLIESEEKFRNLSTQYKMLLESITDAVYALNRDWEYILVNKNAEEIINMPIKNLLGNKIFDVFPGIEQTLFFKTYENVMNTQNGERVIDSFILPDGQMGYYDVSVYPIEEGILCIGKNVTEEKVIEEKLKESEIRYRSLFENMTAAFAYHKIIVDEDDKPINYEFIEANPAFEEFTNLKVEDILGKTVKEILPGIENDPADWIGKYGKVALTGIPLTFENYAEPLDQWYSVSSYSPKKDYFAVTFTNITERKKIENIIKESEEKFRTITEQSLMGIAILQDNVVKYASQRLAEIYGYTVEEMLNFEPYGFLKLIDPDFVELVREQASKKQFGEKDALNHYQVKIVKKTGEKVWVENYSKSINYNGRPADLVTNIDITERKKAEQKVQYQAKLVENVSEAIISTDIDFNIISWNKGAEKIYGWESEEAIGKNFMDLIPVEYPNDEQDTVVKEFFEKGFWAGEVIQPHKNSTSIDVFSSVSLIKDAKGEPIGIVSNNIDITKTKEAEKLIIEENKKLQELSQMRQDLITRISHELKTPLTSIYGVSQALLEIPKEELNEEITEYIEISHRGCIRLRELIGSLLDASRLDTKKLLLLSHKENLTELIEESVNDMTYLLNLRNHAIISDLPKELFFEVDKLRFSQAIINLISNANKNTPMGGKIFISADDTTGYIDIHVRDTGVGLTKKEKEMLFQKFGKIERYGKDLEVDIEGVGLGLYISKEIVELHGGQIIVESKGRNEGATFTIRLFK